MYCVVLENIHTLPTAEGIGNSCWGGGTLKDKNFKEMYGV